MGITISWEGKAKSRDAIYELGHLLRNIAEDNGYKFYEIEEEISGNLYPLWGSMLSDIPSAEERAESPEILYFPLMENKTAPENEKYKSNGWFQVDDGKYKDRVIEELTEGRFPDFTIDTTLLTFIVNVEGCESLCFPFDMKTLEMGQLFKMDDKVFDTGNFCNTLYGGIEGHIKICAILKLSEQYIDFTEIRDEADYYHTLDFENLCKSFQFDMKILSGITNLLKAATKGTGISITTPLYNIDKKDE